jgi:hypothetical protein
MIASSSSRVRAAWLPRPLFMLAQSPSAREDSLQPRQYQTGIAGGPL